MCYFAQWHARTLRNYLHSYILQSLLRSKPATVIRIDGWLHQLHRMAPDQTIRMMEDKLNICDGHFLPFWIIFPFQRMEILDVSKFSDYISIAKDGNPRCLEDFRLYSLFKGLKSPMCRCFPILLPLQRMEIPCTAPATSSYPSLKTHSMAVRAIPLSVCRHGPPNEYRTGFKRCSDAQRFIQLTVVDDINVKAVEAWKQKRSV